MDMLSQIDLGFIFLLGLGGSLHCAGMCGTIACSYTVNAKRRTFASMWQHHLFYFSGRFFIYTWIGAFLGSLGLSAQRVLQSPVLQSLAVWVAGTLLILGGITSFVGHHLPPKWHTMMMQGFRWLIPALKPWNPLNKPWHTFPLGMISGTLPCGLMWAAEAKALATQSISGGAATMFLFCAITSPSIFITASALQKVSPWLRFRSLQFTGLLIIIMGIHLIFGHTGSSSHLHH